MHIIINYYRIDYYINYSLIAIIESFCLTSYSRE